MSAKEKYCYRVLKTYSLLVDFDGQPDRENVPAPVPGETFKHWKKRVLGDDAENVRVYMPIEPAPQSKMERLIEQAQPGHLESIFRAIKRTEKDKAKEAVMGAVVTTTANFSTISKDTLIDILQASGEGLEPSVKEFFERFLKSDGIIETEVVLSKLVESFNKLAREAKQLK